MSKLQSGGALHPEALYVKRECDDQLFQTLMRGEYCLVLAPRAIGKSSLLNHTASRLEEEGAVCTCIDLYGMLGEGDTPNQFLESLIRRLAEALQAPLQPEDQDPTVTASHRMYQFVHRELERCPDRRIVLLLDEVETITRSQSIPTDQVLGFLRALYNERVRRPVFARLAVALFGAINPEELLSDTLRTPFNLGVAVKVTDFTWNEMLRFRPAVPLPDDDALNLLQAVFDQTSGHPFMTQRLLIRSIEMRLHGAAPYSELVKQLVEELYLRPDRIDELSLGKVDLFFRRQEEGQQVPQMLELYARLLEGDPVPAQLSDSTQHRLCMSGLARIQQTTDGAWLSIRNRVIARRFDHAWCRDRLVERQLCLPLQRWQASGRDDALLLSGQELVDARRWAWFATDLSQQERIFLFRSEERVRQQQQSQLAALTATIDSEQVSRLRSEKELTQTHCQLAHIENQLQSASDALVREQAARKRSEAELQQIQALYVTERQRMVLQLDVFQKRTSRLRSGVAALTVIASVSMGSLGGTLLSARQEPSTKTAHAEPPSDASRSTGKLSSVRVEAYPSFEREHPRPTPNRVAGPEEVSLPARTESSTRWLSSPPRHRTVPPMEKAQTAVSVQPDVAQPIETPTPRSLLMESLEQFRSASTEELRRERRLTLGDSFQRTAWAAQRYVIHPVKRISQIAVLPEGVVVAGGRDGSLASYDGVSGRKLAYVAGDGRPIVHLAAASPSGVPFIASIHGSHPRSELKAWTVSEGATRLTLETALPLQLSDSRNPAWMVSLANDAPRLAALRFDQSMVMWDYHQRQQPATSHLGYPDCGRISLSPDGRWIGVGCSSGAVHLYDSNNSNGGDHPIPKQRRPIIAEYFSRDGERLLSVAGGGPDGKYETEWTLWNVRTLHRIAHGQLVTREGFLSALSPDGGAFAIAADGGRVAIFDGITGQQRPMLLTNQAATGRLTQLAFPSGDNRQVLVATAEGSVSVYDRSTNQLTLTYSTMESNNRVFGLSQNGEYAVAGDAIEGIYLLPVSDQSLHRESCRLLLAESSSDERRKGACVGSEVRATTH
jgi:WD40 repeat protein